MAFPSDPSPELADYAHPERLVTTAWLEEHSGEEGLVILESNEDVLLYDTGHIPGALKIDWHTELNDPVVRDYLDGEAFAALMSRKGIRRDDTIVIYGDKSNWWAAYTLWVFTLFGHADVRLLNGGRDAWIAEGRGLTKEVPAPPASEYPVVERTHMPAYPEEGALRGGHIPTARSVPWAMAAQEDGRFKSHRDLVDVYLTKQGFAPGDDVITYCRIGERSSHTWFVMKYLLGFDNVKNYDGSWTEWGSAVRVPIVTGDQPGEAP